MDKALLWEIKGKNIKAPSYLFGTFHLICKEDLNYPPGMTEAFSRCKTLVLENDFEGDSSKQAVLSQLIGPEGYAVRNAFNSLNYERLSRYFEDSMNLDMDRLQKFRPSALYVLLYRKVSPCPNALSMERELLKSASEKGLTLKAMEPTTAVLSGISQTDSTQAAEVIQLLDQGTQGKKMYDSMLLHYKQEDISELYQASKRNGGNTNLEDRNENWIPRMEDQIKQGPTFFAVGAAHLDGNKGLIMLLRQKGYIVKPVRKK
ncbi:TraB/GumN family protein [Chitinophaga sp. OAE865]|uniref:TraB/GumN family protein n=1 Tax=Chitinophaga sp. OAE865 TaxID=2817898 RepID=UPI001AEA7DBC